MTNFVAITEYSFELGLHPHCPRFHEALTNALLEQFEGNIVKQFFTDNTRSVVAGDIVAVIRETSITVFEATSQADQNLIAPMINSKK